MPPDFALMTTESLRRARPMARLFPLLLIAACGVWSSCSGQSGTPAEASDDSESQGLVIQNPIGDRPYFFDFEVIPNGETVGHVFELKNTDTVPITINDLTPSCSCTNPRIEYTAEDGSTVRGNYLEKPIIVIPPGVTASLRIEINSLHVARKNTDKLAMVVLRCDSENRPFMSFELHVVVSKPFQVTPDVINLKSIPVSSGGRATTDLITGLVGSMKRVIGVESTSAGLTAEVEEIQVNGELLWRVSAILTPPLKLGPVRGEVILNCTDDAGNGEGQHFRIPVQGYVVADVVLFPATFAFEARPEDGAMVAESILKALTPGHRIRIADTLLQGTLPDDLKVEVTPQAEDSEGRSGRWKVTLVLPSGIPKTAFSGRLQITLDDPNAEVILCSFAYRPQAN